ncbi:molybdopterin-binding/glycosyltransferase family 2 protein [Microbaculum marinisediminis]|uniref:Molybdopterin-binding/glycosyltransferase family 2 protein n=1 Tax=Microbaculum marinisediminis TaxID=2931392 RepID=A0AAW5R2V4_9HYPH|nr:molybdopterin-binding/glycosyltransferase family 2 protein [Microbaculum sp. A6E488]MCT8972875.1 molybdopterin-binding/glycosyltransferase family 2 protein [Microbaculum sp. A6E488]
MLFGPLGLSDAEGAILAHSQRTGSGTIKKGTVLSADHIAALRAAGLTEVVAARLEAGDVHEDEAAARLAEAVAGVNVRVDRAFTGRANLFSQKPGILTVDRAAIDAFNRIDEAITVATLDAFAPVVDGTMIATVKIIPFAVPGPSVEKALRTVPPRGLFSVAPYKPTTVGVVSTVLSGTSEKMLKKTARVLADRVAPAGAVLLEELRVPHEPAAVAAALADLKGRGANLLLVFGASAIVDRGDVVPAGIEAAGGTIHDFGMPVDPGNLLLIADMAGTAVVGAPGCARSPRENGFDWVLQRLLAGIPVSREDVTGMGVGGLLMEIESRPQPRAGQEVETQTPKVAAILLAAGQSRRMGGANKLIEQIRGKPMVRIAAEAVLASAARPVFVVTGHQPDQVEAALAGLDVTFVNNPNYAEGLSTSLKTGIEALPADVDGAVVCLGDMPAVEASVIDRLVDVFAPADGRAVVVPTVKGKRGNPVLWGRRFFPALTAIRGDVGARHLIGENAELVTEIEIAGDAVLTDVDTPEALARIRNGQTA